MRKRAYFRLFWSETSPVDGFGVDWKATRGERIAQRSRKTERTVWSHTSNVFGWLDESSALCQDSRHAMVENKKGLWGTGNRQSIGHPI